MQINKVLLKIALCCVVVFSDSTDKCYPGLAKTDFLIFIWPLFVSADILPVFF